MPSSPGGRATKFLLNFQEEITQAAAWLPWRLCLTRQIFTNWRYYVKLNRSVRGNEWIQGQCRQSGGFGSQWPRAARAGCGRPRLYSRTHALMPLLKWRWWSNGLESWLVYTCSNFLQQVNENIFFKIQCQILVLCATDRSSKLSPFSNIFVASSNLSHFVLFTFYTWVNTLAL